MNIEINLMWVFAFMSIVLILLVAGYSLRVRAKSKTLDDFSLAFFRFGGVHAEILARSKGGIYIYRSDLSGIEEAICEELSEVGLLTEFPGSWVISQSGELGLNSAKRYLETQANAHQSLVLTLFAEHLVDLNSVEQGLNEIEKEVLNTDSVSGDVARSICSKLNLIRESISLKLEASRHEKWAPEKLLSSKDNPEIDIKEVLENSDPLVVVLPELVSK
jgi:hypothetical protein